MCRLFRSNGIGSSTYSAKAGRTFEKFGLSFPTRAYNGWEVVAFAINLEKRKSTSESGREHSRSSLNGWGSRKEVTVIYENKAKGTPYCISDTDGKRCVV